MNKALSGMRKAQKREMLPAIDLFPQVEYSRRKIDAAVFGPRAYSTNMAAMQKRYFHSQDLPDVTFKPLTTAQSLAVAGYNFGNLAKPQIFNSSRLQAGLVLRVAEGVWINPLTDVNGNVVRDEKELEQRLSKTNRVNGIYLLEGDTSFVPSASFEKEVQEHEKFLEGGLARGLVHTADKKATTLSLIANKDEYPNGVDVWGFDSVGRPILNVVRLGSYWGLGGDRLYVVGDWDEGNIGYAFGVLESGEASAQKN